MLVTQDIEIVKLFVEHLKESLNLDIKIDSIPEESNSSDIDAIAGPYAIEHTSIDTIKNQRRDNNWFSQSIEGLESYFKDKLDYRLWIQIEYDGIKKGQTWKKNRELIMRWIQNESHNLSYGKNLVVQIEGLDFTLRVNKIPKEELGTGVVFVRVISEDFDPQNEIPYRLKLLIDTKLNKLGKYSNHIKILLIENSDLALMNSQLMMDVINKAINECLPTEIDELWYADSSSYPVVKFSCVLTQ